MIEKLASTGAVVVKFNAESPPSPPDAVTVTAFAAPVAVPVMSNREPSLVLMMLAVTPGLLLAELIAETIPDNVLLRNRC